MPQSRFDKLAGKIEKRPGYSQAEAKALAAWIGRRKYGKKKFAAMSAAGRKKA
jgi:hypothetical protein